MPLPRTAERRPNRPVARRVAPLALLASLALGACADMDHHGGDYPKVGPTRVAVSVVGGQIQLDPSIVIVSGGSPAIVEWRLPAAGALTFPKYGIFIEGEVDFPKTTVIEGRGADAAFAKSTREVVSLPIRRENTSDFSCELLDAAKRIVCKSDHPKPGVYKTTVRVLDGETLLKLDPAMIIRQ